MSRRAERLIITFFTAQRLPSFSTSAPTFRVPDGWPKRTRPSGPTGTIVHRVAPVGPDGRVRFGHPSGTLKVGAEVEKDGNRWAVKKVMMSRSARRLMEGWVRVPPV